MRISDLDEAMVDAEAAVVRAYDIESDTAATAAAMAARYRDLSIEDRASAAEAVAGAKLVFCTVTADQAVTAAKAAAVHLEGDAFWCDLNSCAFLQVASR